MNFSYFIVILMALSLISGVLSYDSIFVVLPFVLLTIILFWIPLFMRRKLCGVFLEYERFAYNVPIMEDIYLCDVNSFRKQIIKDIRELSMTIVLFILLLIASCLTVSSLKGSIFVSLFLIYILTRKIKKLYKICKCLNKIKNNLNSETCLDISYDIYNLNYAEYYNKRQAVIYDDIYMPYPEKINKYIVLSFVFEILAIITGSILIVRDIVSLFNQLNDDQANVESVVVFNMLVGIIVIYYAVADLQRTIRIEKIVNRINKLKK